MQKTDDIKLLAIDDKPDNLITLSAVVRETLPQTHILTATNGLAGIELAAAEDPDVILLDIVMPGMDGFEVCRRIKADDRLKDIPVVFLTALKTDIASRVKALEVGGEGFLAKPLEATELTAQIRAMTKVKAAGRSQRTEKEHLETLVAERTADLRGTLAHLLESEERFHNLFEKAPLGYQSLDSDGRFIEVNHAWLDTLGYKREEVIGKWFGDFLAPEYVQAFRERFPVFKAEGKVHSEFFLMHKDGSRRYISFDGRIGHHADGSFKQTHCILKDETERILAEALLRESNQRYDTFINALPDMAYLKNECGQHIMANKALLAFFGKSNDEVIGKTDFELMPKDNAQACWKSDQKALQSDGILRSEERVNGRDYEPWKFRVRLASGQWGVAGFIRDITERKRMAKALAEEADHRRILIEQSGDGIVILDQEGKVAEANRRFAEMLGYTLEEVRQLNVWDWDAQWTREELLGKVGEVDATGAHFETRHRRKDGSFRDVEISSNGSLYGGRKLVLCVCRDITERKLADAYKEMGLEVLRILNEPGDLKSTLGRVLDEVKNRTGTDAVGLRLQDGEDFPYLAQVGFPEDFLQTENTLVGRSADGVVCRDKDGHVRLECTCGLVISGKTAPSHPLFTRGGSFWTNDSAPLLDLSPEQDPRHHPRNTCIHQGYASVALIPIRDKERIVGLLHLNDRRKGIFTLASVNILEDIAAHIGAALMRKRAEEALKVSEREFRSLAESMPQIVWITRADGWNIYFNQKWVDYTGLTLEESYGHGWNAPFHPDDRQRAWDAWKNATENDAAYCLDCRLRRADGTYRWWLVRGVPLRDAEGKILKWFGTCTDIEHIKQDEARIASQLEELRRWQNVMLGREDRVRELKREVNGLCRRVGEVARYPSQEDATANPQNVHEEEHKR